MLGSRKMKVFFEKHTNDFRNSLLCTWITRIFTDNNKKKSVKIRVIRVQKTASRVRSMLRNKVQKYQH